MLAVGAEIRNHDPLLEAQGLLQLLHRQVHVLLAQVQIGHDLVVIGHLIRRAFQAGEEVVGFVHHLQAVIEFAQIKLQHGIVRIALRGVLENADDLAGLSHLQIELFQPVQQDHVAGFGVDLLQNLRGVFRLAFLDENLTQADVGRQELLVPLDGGAEIMTGLVRLSPFQQMAAHFVGQPNEHAAFLLLVGFRQVRLHQAMLDFQRLVPGFQPDMQVPLAHERGEIGRVQLENVPEHLKRLLEALGALQILGQGEQHLDVAVFNAAGFAVQPDGFRKVFLGPIDVSQPQQGIDVVGVLRQRFLEQADRFGRPFRQERMRTFAVQGGHFCFAPAQASAPPVHDGVRGFADADDRRDEPGADGHG